LCYFLYIASPLTLTEIRSMLPPGASADLASYTDQQQFKAFHPATKTVARILVGGCSCDLVRERLPDPREDERHLRERYRAGGLSRAAVIQALDRHRGRRLPRASAQSGSWREALAAFVAEHARNAGESVYFLGFGVADMAVTLEPGHHRRLTAGEIRSDPAGWLKEGIPTLVR
jgi:hypothetical protein